MFIVTPVHKISNNDSCIGVADTFLLRVLPEPSSQPDPRDSSFAMDKYGQFQRLQVFVRTQCVTPGLKRSGPGGTTVPGLPVAGFGSLPAVTIVNAPPSCLILD